MPPGLEPGVADAPVPSPDCPGKELFDGCWRSGTTTSRSTTESARATIGTYLAAALRR
jgi:hypothetical protein